METYTKLDDNNIEITNTIISSMPKEMLIAEKAAIEAMLVDINSKLDTFK